MLNAEGGISVLLGNGDGTFTAADSPSAPTYPEGIAAGDFNGDGNVDLVVGADFNQLLILFGNGEGTFTPGTAIQSNRTYGPATIAVSDFNGDGKADFVVASDIGISLFLGNWYEAWLQSGQQWNSDICGAESIPRQPGPERFL